MTDTRFTAEDCFSADPPIRLTPEQNDRLGWLLSDSEEQIKLVKSIIALQTAVIGDYVGTTQSASNRDYHLETSKLCKDLVGRLSRDWGRLEKALSLLAEYYQEEAAHADPKGKRPRKLRPQDRLADSLVFMASLEKIDIKVSVSPESDFAKLFRLCCEIAGFDVPTNAAFYLKPWIEQYFEGKEPDFTRLVEIEAQICDLLGMKYPAFFDDIHDSTEK